MPPSWSAFDTMAQPSFYHRTHVSLTLSLPRFDGTQENSPHHVKVHSTYSMFFQDTLSLNLLSERFGITFCLRAIRPLLQVVNVFGDINKRKKFNRGFNVAHT